MMDERLKPVEVKTLLDIKRVIAPFMKVKSPEDVKFQAELTYIDEKTGKKQKESVNCDTIGVSMRQMLLNGFENVKIRTEALREAQELAKEDDYVPNLDKVDIDKIRIAGLDDMIKERLGGYRKGMRIRWDVREGTFEFDPLACKLFEIEADDAGTDG